MSHQFARERMGQMRIFIRWKWTQFKEWAWIKLAWAMPRTLVKWCAIRLMANATQGEYSNQIVPDLTAMDALKRWDA